MDDLSPDLRSMPTRNLSQHRRPNTGESLANQLTRRVDYFDGVANREFALNVDYTHRQ